MLAVARVTGRKDGAGRGRRTRGCAIGALKAAAVAVWAGAIIGGLVGGIIGTALDEKTAAAMLPNAGARVRRPGRRELEASRVRAARSCKVLITRVDHFNVPD